MSYKRQLPENIKSLVFGALSSYRDDANEAVRVIVEMQEGLKLAEIITLQRIEEGSYGICEVCRKEIDFEHMMENPHATCCREHETPADLVIPGFLRAVKTYINFDARLDDLNDGEVDASVATSTHIANVDTSQYNDRTVAIRLKASCWKSVLQYLGAIQRMSKGIYGVCVKCHKDISLAQLKAMPQRHSCVKCSA